MTPQPALRCILVGNQSILIACGELLRQAGHTILAVVTADRDVTHWCMQNGIAHFPPNALLAATAESQPFDYLFSIANYDIIPAEVLAQPSHGGINFHDGPLPRYAGLNTTTWALINGETSHAVTWHRMTSAVDKGAILKHRTLPIQLDDTALTLNARCYEVALECFTEMVDELARNAVIEIPQETTGFRLFSRCKRPSPACLLDWQRPALELQAMVRALTFGPYRNPLGLPKLLLNGNPYVVLDMEASEGDAQTPGLILDVTDTDVCIATSSGYVRIHQLTSLTGVSAPAGEVVKNHDLNAGDVLAIGNDDFVKPLEHLDSRSCANEPFWRSRLLSFEPLDIPFRRAARSTASTPVLLQQTTSELPPALTDVARHEILLVAWLIYLSRLSARAAVDISYGYDDLRGIVAGYEPYLATRVPLHLEIDGDAGLQSCLHLMRAELDGVHEHFTYARDLLLREPALRRLPAAVEADLGEVGVTRVEDLDDYRPESGCGLLLVIPTRGNRVLWSFDPARYDEATVIRMQEQFQALLHDLAQTGGPAKHLAMLSPREREAMADWNATQVAYEAETIHHAFEARVRQSPEARAVVWRDESMSFGELDAAAEQVAQRLRASGVGPDHKVGLLVDRSARMIVGMLGILKSGGAYVPLDPSYPRDRLLHMIEDSQIRIVVTEQAHGALLAETATESLHLDEISYDQGPAGSENEPGPDNLAYVIYTSGSTGRPKGVMITHRNVANFFAGMDQRISHGPSDAWLAVTSMSFDISVLEILWSLTRGLTVVLYAGDDRRMLPQRSTRPIDFSLYYFPSDDGEETQEKMRLLLEGARFADANGFEAVWTPERHFHAFGGLFPNPSVSSAALAAITRNVKIRAGSCVVPLHHPVRVAEEWAFVDNLSQGRVGIGFASGWQPNDFVLAPQNYARRHEAMDQGIAMIRALWRGESVTLPGVDGKPVSITIKPRPVQKELPFWITAAGNPETYRQAGELGANLLTHLLGQSLAEVGEKVKLYREARQKHGHAGEGHVTLMLHTVVGPDEEDVRRKAHDALKRYLASAAGLIKHYASSFPTFKAQISLGRSVDEVFATLSPGDVDALLEHAVARYYETSGLFGTLERCEAMVERCKAIGVDEIACLIDFGMAAKVAEEHLPYLAALRERVVRAGDDAGPDYSIPALIERHGITHLQCTPSMATMLIADRRGREALRRIRCMMVGGEAFPPSLAAELRALLPGDLINMYGPTETTVWSTTHAVDRVDGAISIGRPIANTALYVLDAALQPVPVGVPGELYIAGDGVVRGYWNRPELTAERFLPDPFAQKPGARMYRTGDLVRFAPDGSVDFLGRLDNQVKIRGYRIELGEIEALLRTHEAVHEAVVAVREEDGGKRLAAYLVPNAGMDIEPSELRTFLGKHLAEFMIPSSFTLLSALPLTPNGKVDRRALPAPNEAVGTAAGFTAPSTDTEKQIAESWQFLLKKGRIGVNDDFFHIGGDSLGAVQMAAVLSDAFGVELPLEAIFRAPTVVQLAQTIDTLVNGKQAGVA